MYYKLIYYVFEIYICIVYLNTYMYFKDDVLINILYFRTDDCAPITFELVI